MPSPVAASTSAPSSEHRPAAASCPTARRRSAPRSPTSTAASNAAMRRHAEHLAADDLAARLAGVASSRRNVPSSRSSMMPPAPRQRDHQHEEHREPERVLRVRRGLHLRGVRRRGGHRLASRCPTGGSGSRSGRPRRTARGSRARCSGRCRRCRSRAPSRSRAPPSRRPRCGWPRRSRARRSPAPRSSPGSRTVSTVAPRVVLDVLAESARDDDRRAAPRPRARAGTPRRV